MIGTAIAGAFVALAGIFWAVLKGGSIQRGKDADENLKRLKEGQDAVADARRDGRSNADRLRDNDAKW